MAMKSINDTVKTVGGALKNIGTNKSVQVIRKAGKEVKSVLSNADWKTVIKYTGFLATGIAIGMIARQPEVSKLKGEITKELSINDRLRYAVFCLNRSLRKQNEKYQSLKSYNLIGKISSEKNIKGCIVYQYALKEYVELIIKKYNKEKITSEDVCYMDRFEIFLNNIDDCDEEEIKCIDHLIQERVVPKYSLNIKNMIQFDCLPLIDMIKA